MVTKLLFRLIWILLVSASVLHAQSWSLVWSDEFDVLDSPDIDLTKWEFDTGGRGWGNQELQYHTDRPQNSYLLFDPALGGRSADSSYLVIEAREEKFRNRNYTSARLKTQGQAAWTYGKMEARIKIPRKQGAWPAFWMLGSNFSEVGWPACGEIDVMEWVSSLGASVRGSAHGPGYSGGDSVHGDWKGGITDGFHTYAVEWDPSQIRWYVDGQLYHSATPDPWVFDHDFFIILNLAIGGWGGPVGSAVEFPLRMYVDYVRVFQYDGTPLSPYFHWAASRGLTIGVNSGPGDDPNSDGTPNLGHFAFDTDPIGTGADEGKRILAEKELFDSKVLTLTLPVRRGAVFGTSPPTSDLIDGIRYSILGHTDLQDPWDLPITPLIPALEAGLPALGDYDGIPGPDWEYRTFIGPRIDAFPRAFMKAEVTVP